jgi:hypothetical protein
MSKDFPLFELKQREGATGPMTGANTELFIDGVKQGNVSRVTIDIGARGLAKIGLEMYGRVHVLGRFEDTSLETLGHPEDETD